MGGWRENRIYGLFTLVWAVLTVSLCAVSILLSAPFMGRSVAFRRLTGIWVRHLFCLCGIRFRIEGWEALPEDIRSGRQPAIFVSTHESNLDPPVLITAINVRAVYISKKELKWVPLVGWVA